MSEEKTKIISREAAAVNLATFAIDRTDLKELLSAVPEENTLNMTTIEYELQILKIITVGWGISFYMPVSDRNREPLAQLFWENIRDVAQKISTLTETTSGTSINYFEIIKDRLNTYLKVMEESSQDVSNPASVMGPAFAVTCNHPNDAYVLLTGTKMFTLTLGAVKEYLNSVRIDDAVIN